MRRIVVVFFALSVPGWSQPAQQQAQPPIVVKVEMPPANPWTRVVELVVPGIIGASLALFGVWLNNRTNRTLTEDNRKHELAKALKERHFELTKAFYYEVIMSTHNLDR